MVIYFWNFHFVSMTFQFNESIKCVKFYLDRIVQQFKRKLFILRLKLTTPVLQVQFLFSPCFTTEMTQKTYFFTKSINWKLCSLSLTFTTWASSSFSLTSSSSLSLLYSLLTTERKKKPINSSLIIITN